MSGSTVFVSPVSSSLTGSVRPPGAKSDSVRAVLAATLSTGESLITNPGNGANVHAMVRACRQLGATVDDADPASWTVRGPQRGLTEETELSAGNSGIVLRLLAAVGASTRRCEITTPFADSLGSRENTELLESLPELGALCAARDNQGRLPVVVGRDQGLHGGLVKVSGARSSQFLSGLLFLAPLIGEDVEIRVVDQLSATSMVRTTLQTLARAGIQCDADPDLRGFRIAGGQRYRPGTFSVSADASSVAGACAAAAAVPGSQVLIDGLWGNDNGTSAMLDALTQLGAGIEVAEGSARVTGAEQLRAIDFDGSACPDSILAVAALACFAEGTSTFYNIETMRYKECDRISDFRRELLAAGADVEERQDALIVHGRPAIAGGVTVGGCHDHAVVMALAVLAMRSRAGLRIDGWKAVFQTYPSFFRDLATLGVDVDSDARGLDTFPLSAEANAR
jgi:3-phosphoshikimate 1-carboxyvinyltransferase